MHTILVLGLAYSARLWDTLMPTALASGAVTIADSRRDDTITGMAERLLADAPPRFAVAGISMGGYVSLEVMTIALEWVAGLALISTSAASDTPEQQRNRQAQSAMAKNGRFDDLVEAAFVALVDASNREDLTLRNLWSAMAHEVGVEVFLTQQHAALNRAARDLSWPASLALPPVFTARTIRSSRCTMPTKPPRRCSIEQKLCLDPIHPNIERRHARSDGQDVRVWSIGPAAQLPEGVAHRPRSLSEAGDPLQDLAVVGPLLPQATTVILAGPANLGGADPSHPTAAEIGRAANDTDIFISTSPRAMPF